MGFSGSKSITKNVKKIQICDEEKDKKEQIKLEDKLENIKSKYIFNKIFNILKTKRRLNLIRFNKNIKKRLNININDYKEYFEIEIEIKPVNNEYGKFININKEDEIYYHIYFNNNREEIKRNYLNENENVEKIKIIIDHQIKSFEKLFVYRECVECIYFKKFYRNNINNMSFMFSDCSSLKELNLNNFNTENVKDMSGMLSRCLSLKELIFNNF